MCINIIYFKAVAAGKAEESPPAKALGKELRFDWWKDKLHVHPVSGTLKSYIYIEVINNDLLKVYEVLGKWNHHRKSHVQEKKKMSLIKRDGD